MAAAPVDFGMEIDCGGCGWRREPGGLVVFYTLEPPRVLSVVPGGPADLAGIRPEDVLLKVDGIPLRSRDGGEHLGELRPGQPVTLQVGRGELEIGSDVDDVGVLRLVDVEADRRLAVDPADRAALAFGVFVRTLHR